MVGSQVAGSTGAIALTQASSTHYYQRPGSGLVYDTTRTSLSGDAEKISFGKIGGGVVRFNTNFSRFSPGLEINDLGYLAEAGRDDAGTTSSRSISRRPAPSTARCTSTSARSNAWTAQGLSAAYMSTNSVYFNGDVQFKNSWWIHTGGDLNRWHTAYDDRKARGGPALRGHPFTDGYFGIEGDPRLSAIPSVNFSPLRWLGREVARLQHRAERPLPLLLEPRALARPAVLARRGLRELALEFHPLHAARSPTRWSPSRRSTRTRRARSSGSTPPSRRG